MASTVETRSASPTMVKSLTSPGGVEAWHVESDVVPLIAVAFTFEGGSAQDPADRPGVAQMLSRLLDEGAGNYDSDAFQERLAGHAIELSFNAGNDAIGGSLKTLVKHADEAFELLRLALAEPRFDADAIERVRAQTIAGLRYQQNDPGVMATRQFFEAGFPDHPYARPTSGTVESVQRITRDDIVEMHRLLIARGRVKIAVVGAIDSRPALDIDRQGFQLPCAGRAARSRRARAAGGDRPTAGGRSGRAAVGHPVRHSGITWRDPGFIPAYVLNHVLGGGAFTSRLFQEVREKRGLAYSVGTSLVSYRASSITWGYTATKNERVVECLDVIASEIGRLHARWSDR